MHGEKSICQKSFLKHVNGILKIMNNYYNNCESLAEMEKLKRLFFVPVCVAKNLSSVDVVQKCPCVAPLFFKFHYGDLLCSLFSFHITDQRKSTISVVTFDFACYCLCRYPPPLPLATKELLLLGGTLCIYSCVWI